MKVCTRCHTKKEESAFYNRPDKPAHYCKACFNSYCKLRWIKVKIESINYLGGKCNICGIANLHPSLYDFHHRDPKIKEFNFTKMRQFSPEKRNKELDKCDLLCCMCHRIYHLKGDWDTVLKECGYEYSSPLISDVNKVLTPSKPIVNIAKTWKTCHCGKIIDKTANMCKTHSLEIKRKFNWPSEEELKRLVWEKSTVLIARDYGVSDTAISKLCKKYNIPKPPRGYWAKIYSKNAE